MNIDLKNNIAAEAQSANFFDELPVEMQGFKLKKIFAEDEDKFDYFSFDDEKNHLRLTAYFHAETMEYKVRARIGLNEFCLTKFFTSDFKHFIEILTADLEQTLQNLNKPVDAESEILIKAKKIPAWIYGQKLPKNLEGFELFIMPTRPVKFTNGSYIIINYSNFETDSDVNIFYNVYGENFSGETRSHGAVHVSYLFDAENLEELEDKLEKNLVAELKILNDSREYM